eukprot:jgi/Bigna1/131571/aug1.14_g6279
MKAKIQQKSSASSASSSFLKRSGITGRPVKKTPFSSKQPPAPSLPTAGSGAGKASLSSSSAKRPPVVKLPVLEDWIILSSDPSSTNTKTTNRSDDNSNNSNSNTTTSSIREPGSSSSSSSSSNNGGPWRRYYGRISRLPGVTEGTMFDTGPARPLSAAAAASAIAALSGCDIDSSDKAGSSTGAKLNRNCGRSSSLYYYYNRSVIERKYGPHIILGHGLKYVSLPDPVNEAAAEEGEGKVATTALIHGKTNGSSSQRADDNKGIEEEQQRLSERISSMSVAAAAARNDNSTSSSAASSSAHSGGLISNKTSAVGSGEEEHSELKKRLQGQHGSYSPSPSLQAMPVRRRRASSTSSPSFFFNLSQPDGVITFWHRNPDDTVVGQALDVNGVPNGTIIRTPRGVVFKEKFFYIPDGRIYKLGHLKRQRRRRNKYPMQKWYEDFYLKINNNNNDDDADNDKFDGGRSRNYRNLTVLDNWHLVSANKYAGTLSRPLLSSSSSSADMAMVANGNVSSSKATTAEDEDSSFATSHTQQEVSVLYREGDIIFLSTGSRRADDDDDVDSGSDNSRSNIRILRLGTKAPLSSSSSSSSSWRAHRQSSPSYYHHLPRHYHHHHRHHQQHHHHLHSNHLLYSSSADEDMMDPVVMQQLSRLPILESWMRLNDGTLLGKVFNRPPLRNGSVIQTGSAKAVRSCVLVDSFGEKYFLGKPLDVHVLANGGVLEEKTVPLLEHWLSLPDGTYVGRIYGLNSMLDERVVKTPVVYHISSPFGSERPIIATSGGDRYHLGTPLPSPPTLLPGDMPPASNPQAHMMMMMMDHHHHHIQHSSGGSHPMMMTPQTSSTLVTESSLPSSSSAAAASMPSSSEAPAAPAGAAISSSSPRIVPNNAQQQYPPYTGTAAVYSDAGLPAPTILHDWVKIPDGTLMGKLPSGEVIRTGMITSVDERGGMVATASGQCYILGGGLGSLYHQRQAMMMMMMQGSASATQPAVPSGWGGVAAAATAAAAAAAAAASYSPFPVAKASTTEHHNHPHNMATAVGNGVGKVFHFFAAWKSLSYLGGHEQQQQ